MSHKQCGRCDFVQPYSRFTRHKGTKDGYHNYCRGCRNKEVTVSRQRRMRILDRYKTIKGCAQCGYRAHPYALQFDHIDPSTKKHTIANMMTHSWEGIKKELGKCQVLCGNCHNIKSVSEQRGELKSRLHGY